MKIAIALRTCDSVLSYWGSKRFVECTKPNLLLTCLHSLLKSISYNNKFGQDEVAFSIHDDSSSQKTLDCIDRLVGPTQFGIQYELINSGKLNNFRTQYEWAKQQDCDYLYLVEDDYLHYVDCIREMRNIVLDMKDFLPGDYAVHPFNNPHRYKSFDMLYTSYVLKGRSQYWRSCFHSTHTFFISKSAFDLYDHIMKKQATAFPHCTEDASINQVWREQRVRLLTPINSLALHMADESQEDSLSNWEDLWMENYCEAW